MFGWFNDCTECLILSRFGEDAWHETKLKANFDIQDGGFLRYKYYDDADTVRLFVAASEVLGVTVDEVLFALGDFFDKFVLDNGYSNVLAALGSNLRDWLSNLNSLHDHLKSSYPKGFVAPVFWSEDDVDFEHTKEGARSNAILVHYFSHRGSLLVPFVHGLIKRVARVHFGIEINMEQLQIQDERRGINHTTWRVTAMNRNESHKLRGKKKQRRRKPKTFGGSDDHSDEVTVTTLATTHSNYEMTFLEGEVQAAHLRVEEFIKQCVSNPDCELYHSLTFDEYNYLLKEWKSNKIDGNWCYNVKWTQDGISSSWPTLADLPPKLNPATFNPLKFSGKVPTKYAYPPDEYGRLPSFPPLIQVVNRHTSRSCVLSVKKSSELNLEDAVYNSQAVEFADLKSFPNLQHLIDNGSYEIQVVIWDEATQNPYHTFTIGDLQMVSTLQLFETVPNTFDPIILSVHYEEIIAVADDEEEI